MLSIKNINTCNCTGYPFICDKKFYKIRISCSFIAALQVQFDPKPLEQVCIAFPPVWNAVFASRLDREINDCRVLSR